MKSPPVPPLRWRKVCALLGGILLLALGTGQAEAPPSASRSPTPLRSRITDWWKGPNLTGEWLGLRPGLEARGIRLTVTWRGAGYGVVGSQGDGRGFYDQQVAFAGELNVGKFLQVEELQILTGFVEGRWRDPRQNSNPNEAVQGSNMFNPSHYQNGTGWRLLSFGLEVTSGDLLPVKDMLVLRGGWLQPQREFVDQPLSDAFVNNAIQSAKGLGGNIPFSASFSTWGGTLKGKLADWQYTKVGVFMAFPEATSPGNHGLAFQGFAPNFSQNSLMIMAETGFQPKFGPAKLGDKYAIGGYYFGLDQAAFDGTEVSGQYGFYLQADQMLFREPSSAPPPAPLMDKASGGTPQADREPSSTDRVRMAQPKLEDQGLSVFSLVTLAPAYNNLYPFYCQSGLVYQGLIPGRDKDLTQMAVAFGDYSSLSNQSLPADAPGQPNYTLVMEWDYRFQINGWSFLQPFVQYIIKPDNNSAVQNATIVGVLVGLDF